MVRHPHHRILLLLALLPAILPLLACTTVGQRGLTATARPRWACPTPTPRPYGPDGPVKAWRDGPPDPLTGTPVPEPIYYTIWEQEYGALGDPAPAPTPYTKSDGPFFLGQIVNLSRDLAVQADATATDSVTGTQQLQRVTLTWTNRGPTQTLVLDRQVVVSGVGTPDGRVLTGEGWASGPRAAALAGLTTTATRTATIGAGQTVLAVPILTPPGHVQTLDLRLDMVANGATEASGLRVQWVRGAEPHCAQPGTPDAVSADAAPALVGPPAPPHAPAAVAFAYSQVGRPYCWGGKGWTPCSGCDAGSGCVTPSCAAQGGLPCWDCSGLTWGAYAHIGVVIGHGTANQQHLPVVWQVGSAVDPATVTQAGDLLLFSGVNAHGRMAQITHVGLYDGAGAMVHAASYPDGVLVTPRIFANAYYRERLVLVTRPPAH